MLPDCDVELLLTSFCPLQITTHINGMNHVQRIADLADVSSELTRHCLEHLLYAAEFNLLRVVKLIDLARFYQCIIMIDIFQYSNMYTLKSNFQWLAEEISVQEECSQYVTCPGVIRSTLFGLVASFLMHT